MSVRSSTKRNFLSGFLGTVCAFVLLSLGCGLEIASVGTVLGAIIGFAYVSIFKHMRRVWYQGMRLLHPWWASSSIFQWMSRTIPIRLIRATWSGLLFLRELQIQILAIRVVIVVSYIVLQGTWYVPLLVDSISSALVHMDGPLVSSLGYQVTAACIIGLGSVLGMPIPIFLTPDRNGRGTDILVYMKLGRFTLLRVPAFFIHELVRGIVLCIGVLFFAAIFIGMLVIQSILGIITVACCSVLYGLGKGIVYVVRRGNVLPGTVASALTVAIATWLLRVVPSDLVSLVMLSGVLGAVAGVLSVLLGRLNRMFARLWCVQVLSQTEYSAYMDRRMAVLSAAFEIGRAHV